MDTEKLFSQLVNLLLVFVFLQPEAVLFGEGVLGLLKGIVQYFFAFGNLFLQHREPFDVGRGDVRLFQDGDISLYSLSQMSL